MSLEKIILKIHDSLKSGFPVTYGTNNHAMLIYGAEYSADGNPTVYYIKNSYSDYFYKANPEALHGTIVEITTLE